MLTKAPEDEAVIAQARRHVSNLGTIMLTTVIPFVSDLTDIRLAPDTLAGERYRDLAQELINLV